jgi:tetratricopeptide (TPR) repeat protein
MHPSAQARYSRVERAQDVTDTILDESAADGKAVERGRRPWVDLILVVAALALLAGILVAAYFVVQAAQPGQQPQTMEEAQIQQLQQQIKQSPKATGLYLQLAGSYYKVKAYDKALQSINDLQSLHPTGTVLAESIYAQAKISEVRGDQNAAIAGYGKSLAVTETPDTRWALGVLYLNRKQYGDAIKNLQRYTAIMPTDADGLARLGAAYAASGDRAKALVAYQKAKSFVPDNPAVLAAIKRLGGQR